MIRCVDDISLGPQLCTQDPLVDKIIFYYENGELVVRIDRAERGWLRGYDLFSWVRHLLRTNIKGKRAAFAKLGRETDRSTLHFCQFA